jgi:hypothetical protein
MCPRKYLRTRKDTGKLKYQNAKGKMTEQNSKPRAKSAHNLDFELWFVSLIFYL